jgi:hypothetical protein
VPSPKFHVYAVPEEAFVNTTGLPIHTVVGLALKLIIGLAITFMVLCFEYEHPFANV